MIKHQKMLIFDFETTGLDPLHDQIIEIGAIQTMRTPKGYIVTENGELNCLVMTKRPLPPKIIEITGITDEMILRNGITEEEAFHKIARLIDDETLLIAYNIHFDLGFLTALYKKYDPSFLKITNDILDVMAIYKDRHQYPHRLESAIEKYQIAAPTLHRALDDVVATRALLNELRIEKSNINKYVNVIGFNPKYPILYNKLSHVTYLPQSGGKLDIENK